MPPSPRIARFGRTATPGARAVAMDRFRSAGHATMQAAGVSRQLSREHMAGGGEHVLSLVSYYARNGYARRVVAACSDALARRGGGGGGEPLLVFWRALGLLLEGAVNDALREYEGLALRGDVQVSSEMHRARGHAMHAYARGHVTHGVTHGARGHAMLMRAAAHTACSSRSRSSWRCCTRTSARSSSTWKRSRG